MQILVISHEFPPVGGGGGHIARDLCQTMSERGHEVKVLTADLIGGVSGVDGCEFDVIRTPTWRKDPSRASLLAMFTFVISGLIRGLVYLRRWKPDLIHVHFAVPSGPIAWVLSIVFGIPYVLTAHLGDVPGGTPEKTDKWFRFIYPFTPPIWKGAASVIAVSEFTRNLALERYDVPIEVIHNGVDLGAFTEREEGVHDPPRVVFAGRFVPQKNPLAIVRVLDSLKDLAWECTMLGDGPLYQEVWREIEELGLQDRIQIPGWVSPEEVRRTFCRSDILFMPSYTEGLPVVGVQALAAGLAFVVSDIGGFIDLVDDGENGYRVPLENASSEKFMEKLSCLLINQSRIETFKTSSRARAQKFDIAYIAYLYEQLFSRVVNRKVV